MTITPGPPPKPVAPDALTLWAARARVALLEDLTTTGTCVADNLHRVGEPNNPRRWGGVFSDPLIRPLMRHAGYTRSTRKERHGGPVGIWELRPGRRNLAQAQLTAARKHLAHLEELNGGGDQLPINAAPATRTRSQQLSLPLEITEKPEK